ncbi:hypothetical protein D9758_011652 [Tetrapyrgos nigripes]|uniref:Major facilitator superfamily (MFS) profile domain-containing protein n=1 Tax=Tetrapyrgos nigripes TaxID=182062 RepID=A0A8H5CTG2_9AGAR|nr:hypothetical protein D9758_011652 [Tetrapyrgos nigripes]
MSKQLDNKKKSKEEVQVDLVEVGGVGEVAGQKQARRSTAKSVLLVATCTLALMVHTSNNIAISITLPVIQRALNVPQVQLQWLVSAYALSSGCLLLVFGRVADIYGRKKVFIFGSSWLTVFTLGCAFAQDSLTLDILRGLQGIGAAATIPAAIGTLAATFPPSRARAIAFSTQTAGLMILYNNSFSSGSPLGATLGTAVGGVLNQKTSATWKASFYLNCVLAFVSVIGAIFSFERDKPSLASDRRIDWFGAFTVTSGLVLIVFVLGEGEVAPQKWATPYIIGLLVTGVILTLLFGFWQHYLEQVHDDLRSPLPWLPSPPPLMRLSLWTRSKWRVTVVMLIALLNWASFLGWNFWTVLYYENFSSLTPIATVLRLLPQFITGIFCNIIVARFVGQVPLVVLIAAGTSLSGVASLLFAIINPNATYWAFGFPSAILSVFGANFVFASGTLFISAVSAPSEQSVVGAVFQEMTQIGSSLGVTISTVVFNRVLQQTASDRGFRVTNSRGNGLPRDVQLKAYQAAEWTNFAFGMIAIAFLSSVGIVGARRKPEGLVLDEAVDGSDNFEFAQKADASVPSTSLTNLSQPVPVIPNEIDTAIPWHHLRELDLASCNLQTALRVLLNCAGNLTRCNLGQVTFGDIQTEWTPRMTITMFRLHTFSLHLSEAGPQLLDCLTLTSVYDLTLMEIKASQSIDNVINLLVRSACYIRRLKLLDFPLMDVTLIRLLRRTPGLEELELKGWIWNDLWLNMTRSTSPSVINPVVPHLKVFRLYGRRIFHVEVLQTMLNSRIVGGSEEFQLGDPDEDASRLQDLDDEDDDQRSAPGRLGSPSNTNGTVVGEILVDVKNTRSPVILDARRTKANTKEAADMAKNWNAALSDTLLAKFDINVENIGIIDELLTEIEWYSRSAEHFIGSSILRITLRAIAQRETPQSREVDVRKRTSSLVKVLK